MKAEIRKVMRRRQMIRKAFNYSAAIAGIAVIGLIGTMDTSTKDYTHQILALCGYLTIYLYLRWEDFYR